MPEETNSAALILAGILGFLLLSNRNGGASDGASGGIGGAPAPDTLPPALTAPDGGGGVYQNPAAQYGFISQQSARPGDSVYSPYGPLDSPTIGIKVGLPGRVGSGQTVAFAGPDIGLTPQGGLTTMPQPANVWDLRAPLTAPNAHMAPLAPGVPPPHDTTPANARPSPILSFTPHANDPIRHLTTGPFLAPPQGYQVGQHTTGTNGRGSGTSIA